MLEGIVDYIFEFDPELRELVEGRLIADNRLTDQNGNVVQVDGPVNQADLGGLPKFGNTPGPREVQTSESATSGRNDDIQIEPQNYWRDYLAALEREFQKEEGTFNALLSADE
jgi:hypothetical protein